VHPEHVLVTPARMARWRRRGLAVTTWTVDSPDRWRVLRELGVDAIVTNDPARLRAALAGAGQAGAW
jgi:glycerophosphoryl diester phosphodiesterase